MEMKENCGSVKKALILGFAAAVMLCAVHGETAVQKQTFLFPQFTSSAAAQKNGGSEEQTEFVYRFKIAELIGKLFK
jgi:hypothetical protein